MASSEPLHRRSRVSAGWYERPSSKAHTAGPSSRPAARRRRRPRRDGDEPRCTAGAPQRARPPPSRQRAGPAPREHAAPGRACPRASSGKASRGCDEPPPPPAAIHASPPRAGESPSASPPDRTLIDPPTCSNAAREAGMASAQMPSTGPAYLGSRTSARVGSDAELRGPRREARLDAPRGRPRAAARGRSSGRRSAREHVGIGKTSHVARAALHDYVSGRGLRSPAPTTRTGPGASRLRPGVGGDRPVSPGRRRASKPFGDVSNSRQNAKGQNNVDLGRDHAPQSTQSATVWRPRVPRRDRPIPRVGRPRGSAPHPAGCWHTCRSTPTGA